MRRRLRVLGGVLLGLALLVPASAPADVQPKVVGGSSVSISQYPWQAAVVYSPSRYPGLNAHERQFCGGSLITTRIVITAGHCVVGLSPSDVDVVLGRTTLSNTSEGAEVGVQAVSLRSNFVGSTAPRYDVGYLVLSSPSSQPRIQIAGGGEAALWSPGVVEEISGWGCTSEPFLFFGCSTSDSLRAARVPIVSDSTCSSDYGGLFDPTTMVCAGYQSGGADSCSGDSGGPLEGPAGSSTYRLVGLTSWGAGCGEAGSPGVYTRVAGAAIRPLVGADVCGLETTYGLAHEQVIAGATLAEEPCLPPASSTAGATTKKAGPFAKCKRIKNKRKRHRCIKKVRKKLKSRR